MTHTYLVLLTRAKPDEVGFTVEVPSLPGCITEGDSLDDALRNADDAIRLYIESLEADALPLPPSDTPDALARLMPEPNQLVTVLEVSLPAAVA
jgi:predicted RNase H-like HicB family nuclease